MSKEEYKDAIEVSVIFHEGQRMFAVPKQPAQQEPEYIQLRHKEEDGFSPWGQLLDPKYRHNKWAAGVEMRLLYTSPPAQRTWVGLTDEERDAIIGVTDLSGTYYYDDLYAVILAAEGKLAEKNT